MKNLIDLTGQRLFVSGAGGAIGGAAARACATLGAELVIADLRRPEALEAELRAEGVKVESVALDNTDRAAVDALFARLGPLDAVADCSGYYVKGDWEKGDDAWEKIFANSMNVNVRGPLNLARACLPGMVARGSGRMVLVGSMAARNAGSTLAVEPAYAASKGALHTMVRYLCRQVADKGVVVNGVSPGPILTPLLISANQPFETDSYPMKRLGKPEEIGWPVAFLCSRATGFMTGAVVDVNGGMVFS